VAAPANVASSKRIKSHRVAADVATLGAEVAMEALPQLAQDVAARASTSVAMVK
jgi:hypothetical protein